MNQVSCFIVIVGYCLSLTNAQISEHFEYQQMDALKLVARAALSQPSTLGDAYFASQILKSVDATGPKCNCAAIGEHFDRVQSNIDVYYGVESSLACGCAIDVPVNLKSAAINGLQVFIFFIDCILQITSF